MLPRYFYIKGGRCIKFKLMFSCPEDSFLALFAALELLLRRICPARDYRWSIVETGSTDWMALLDLVSFLG